MPGGVKGGAECPPGSEKFAKNQEKRGKLGKRGKNWKKRQKSGRFLHFALPDRAGYATDYTSYSSALCNLFLCSFTALSPNFHELFFFFANGHENAKIKALENTNFLQ